MNNYLSPENLIFLIGLFQAILLVIFLPILYFTKLIILGNIQFDRVLTLFFYINQNFFYYILLYKRIDGLQNY